MMRDGMERKAEGVGQNYNLLSSGTPQGITKVSPVALFP